MMKSPIGAYKTAALTSKIMGETPHGLVRMLLEKACEKLSLAEESVNKMAKGENIVENTIAFSQATNHASETIASLRDALVPDASPTLYGQLKDLYDHIQYQIFLGVKEKKPEPIRQAHKVVSEVLDIWMSIPAEYHGLSSLD